MCNKGRDMLQTIPAEQEFLTAAEIARLLQVNVMAVYRWRDEGKLTGVKFGHRTVRFHRDDVIDFIDKSTEEAGEPAAAEVRQLKQATK